MNFTLLPGRLIPPKSRALTGRVTLRDGTSACFESSLERDCLIRLDFELAGRILKPQPFTLEYAIGTKTRHYTPDLLVQYGPSENRPLEVIEVKFAADLQDEIAKHRDKFEAMRTFCATQSWDFRILTEKEIRGDAFLENATFLRRYLNSERNDEHAWLICSMLKTLRSATADELIVQTFQASSMRATGLWTLWSLIANQFIVFDWALPLRVNSTPLRLSTVTTLGVEQLVTEA